MKYPELALVGLTVFWGATFPVVRQLSLSYSGLELVSIRFVVSTLVLLPLVFSFVKNLSRRDVLLSVLMGVVLFAGYLTQTVGAALTTSARGGFITSLNAIFVPLLAVPFLGEKMSPRKVVGLVLALMGMLVLALDATSSSKIIGSSVSEVEKGDALVFACAVLFALHIVLVTKFASKISTLAGCFVQMATVAVLAVVLTLTVQQDFSPITEQYANLIFLSLIGTAFVFIVQVKAQKYTTAVTAGIIFTLEPVFATLFGWLLAGEEVTSLTLFAGVLMILGVVTSLSRKPLPH